MWQHHSVNMNPLPANPSLQQLTLHSGSLPFCPPTNAFFIVESRPGWCVLYSTFTYFVHSGLNILLKPVELRAKLIFLHFSVVETFLNAAWMGIFYIYLFIERTKKNK